MAIGLFGAFATSDHFHHSATTAPKTLKGRGKCTESYWIIVYMLMCFASKFTNAMSASYEIWNICLQYNCLHAHYTKWSCSFNGSSFCPLFSFSLGIQRPFTIFFSRLSAVWIGLGASPCSFAFHCVASLLVCLLVSRLLRFYASHSWANVHLEKCSDLDASRL